MSSAEEAVFSGKRELVRLVSPKASHARLQ
jgi:hypothetical protein